MAMLTAEMQAQILALHYSDRRSIKSIAREFGIDRKTVRRLVRRREVRLSIVAGRRRSILDPFKEEIRTLLLKDGRMTGTSILNRLRQMGYTGGTSTLHSYLQIERGRFARPREAFLRLEFMPGEVAQVDWGEFGDVFGDGVKVHCFAMVLAHSRMVYAEFTRSEKLEEFLRCHESAFRFFGGAPRECWYDNLATAVSDRVGGLVRFNPRFLAYMGHHSVRPVACNVARGNEKGRVEDFIKYLRTNFWGGRDFKDFEDLNFQLRKWQDETANVREHRSLRKVVRIVFEMEEKPRLLAINPVPYDTDEIFSRQVSPDFHLQYESNRYSVPWTLVGMTVTVRVTSIEVKVYYHEKFVCSHVRSYLKGAVITNEPHRAGLLERKPGGSRDTWQLNYVKGLGPKMAEYVEVVRQGPRSLKYELSRLIGLVTIYGEALVVSACKECLSSGVVGVDNLELYLKRSCHPSETRLQPALIKYQNEKLNRVHPEVDLQKYDALYFGGEISKAWEEKDGNTKRARGAETQILEPGHGRGPGEHEGARQTSHHEVPVAMGPEGKEPEAFGHDPIESENGEVPQSSDS